MIENIYHVKIDRDKSVQQQVFLLADRMCGMFKRKDAAYVTLAAHLTECDYKLPKSCYEDVEYLPFETIQIPVPKDYDTVLSIKYGNYMTPVRARGGHDYPFFKKQIELCDSIDFKLYDRYEFHKSDLSRSEKMEEKLSLKVICQNMLSLLKEAHNTISDFAQSENWNTVLTLLADCQDAAVAMGEKIEIVKENNTNSISLLESYCELLYSYYEMINSERQCDISGMIKTLDECLVQIEESVTREIISRREVVFLPYKSTKWNFMEEIWKAACADDQCDVYVVPIPYYYKNCDGSWGQMHYDREDYPENIVVWDYNTFDFGLHCPDAIFIQEPHDQFNAGISVPEFFYSDNLREFTNCLVYLPDFVVDEIEDTDERGKISLEYFCMVPGVIRSDVVVVQSEQMKKVYVEALTEFAGKDTTEIWNEKIVAFDQREKNLYDYIKNKWVD